MVAVLKETLEKLKKLISKPKITKTEARDYFFTKMRNNGMMDEEIEGWWEMFLLSRDISQ
jgi:Asp-tRNA(Asn)/Glu-tRNA(Gln) amidotransferase B subunit